MAAPMMTFPLANGTLDANVLPLMLGDFLHLDAANAAAPSSVLAWKDLVSADIFVPGGSYSPAIVTESGFKHVSIKGMAQSANDGGVSKAPWTKLAGIKQASIYMAFRIVAQQANSTFLKLTSVDSPSENMFLRRSASTAKMQFQMGKSGGIGTVTSSNDYSTGAFIGAVVQFDTVNQKVLVRHAGVDTEASTTGVVPMAGGVELEFGTNRASASQGADIDMRGCFIFAGYHSVEVRAAMLADFAGLFGVMA